MRQGSEFRRLLRGQSCKLGMGRLALEVFLGNTVQALGPTNLLTASFSSALRRFPRGTALLISIRVFVEALN